MSHLSVNSVPYSVLNSKSLHSSICSCFEEYQHHMPVCLEPSLGILPRLSKGKLPMMRIRISVKGLRIGKLHAFVKVSGLFLF